MKTLLLAATFAAGLDFAPAPLSISDPVLTVAGNKPDGGKKRNDDEEKEEDLACCSSPKAWG